MISLTEPLLSADSPVSSGSVVVPPYEAVEGSRQTAPPASTSPGSSDEAASVGVEDLKFLTPPGQGKDPSEDTSGMPISFTLCDREVRLINSKSALESTYNLCSRQARIFAPATWNHLLSDGFLVAFPNVRFFQVTKRDHGNSVFGCPIIESIRSRAQSIADEQAEKDGKEFVPVWVKYLLVGELPFSKCTWALPRETGATDGDVYCLRIFKFGVRFRVSVFV